MTNVTRRDLLRMIGYTAGASVMYQAMGGLGFAAESPRLTPPKLGPAPKDASVIILGAGIAGMVAAYELKKAGYKVKILEYQSRAGGRAHSVYGGDRYTDTDGVTQECHFDPGLYFNVGPWRIPYHHRNVLHYCQELGIKLDPFVQINFNSYLHAQNAFGGEPKRFRELFSDFNGHIAELLSKSIHQTALDETVTKEDQERLLEELRAFGGLDNEFRYTAASGSPRRGFSKPLGGGLTGAPELSTPLELKDLLDANAWQRMSYHFQHTFQQTMFEPKGGMEMIGKAFGKALEGTIQYNAVVTEIDQSDAGVTVTYRDQKNGDTVQTESADFCLCTIPLPILRTLNISVNDGLKQAIDTIPYASVVKVGAQYNRRFWEEDEAIYGGMTLTDFPISHIAYPSATDEILSRGKGILLNGYIAGPNGVEYTKLAPDARVKETLKYVGHIHPQALDEYDTGYSTAWDKVPWIQGGYTSWNDALRETHYKTLAEMDGRIVLAGEHVSYISGWLEGAVTSSLDAIERLHEKAVSLKG